MSALIIVSSPTTVLAGKCPLSTCGETFVIMTLRRPSAFLMMLLAGLFCIVLFFVASFPCAISCSFCMRLIYISFIYHNTLGNVLVTFILCYLYTIPNLG